jgi:hypothetical protein
MSALLIAIAVSSMAAVCGWFLDTRLTRTKLSARVVFALVLLTASMWLASIILAEQQLIDMTVTANQFFMFRMRVVAVFLVLGCMPVALATAAFTVYAIPTDSSVPKWRLRVVPILALTTFALAVYLYDTHGYYPTA